MKGRDASTSSSSSSAESSSPYLPLLPLSLALLYAVSAHAFQAAWHEVAWSDRDRCRSVAGRAALLGAAAAAVSAMSVPRARTPAAHATTTLTALSAAASAYLIQQTRQRHVQGPHRTNTLTAQSLRGRVYLITGANTGVGYATARQLYEAGATVVLGCRSEKKAREAMERIRNSSVAVSGEEVATSNPNHDGANDQRLIFVPIDVSDLTSVRRAARHFQSLSLPLHTLILNAGIMMADRRESVDGHELTLAANHLGHFLLANLLLPSMRTVDDPRVVVLTSSTYQLASPGGIDFDDLQCRHRPYTMFSQYAQTKLANILFVKELARREETLRQTAVEADANDANNADDDDDAKSTTAATVKAYAVHPGLVRTDVVRNMPWYLYYPNTIFGFAVAALQKTPEAGAWTTVFCATSADVLDESGSYYVNSRREAVEAFANDEEAASKLWTISEELVGLKR